MKLSTSCVRPMVAAAIVLGLGLHEAGGEIFFQESFQGDLPGTVPASATFTQITGANSLIAVVDAASTPPDPFGGEGNKSIAMLDRIGGSADIRTGFKGNLPDAGLATGTIKYKLYGFDNGVAPQPPLASIRAGLNNDVTGGTRLLNDEAAFLLTFQAPSFNPQIVILEGSSANTTFVLEQTWEFNRAYEVIIDFDAIAKTWSATLDGVQLTKPGGISTFNFWYPVTGVNQFDLVSGAGSNQHSTVFFDDILIEGEANAVTSADFNGDGSVDGSDFLIWQRGYGLSDQSDATTGDATGDGNVDDADLLIWTEQFGVSSSAFPAVGAVPEPAALVQALTVAIAALSVQRLRLREPFTSINDV
jgi:uncharacterized protein (DUF2141 family)